MSEIKASTQEHLDIEDIRDDFVILKNGAVVAVLEVGAVNFDLLSEREQDAMIEAYAGLLNSLSFAIQILVRSQKLDISSYLTRLKDVEKTQTNPALKGYVGRYHDFVKELITKNDVLDKGFYVVIPHQEVRITLENPLGRILRLVRGEPESRVVVDVVAAITAAKPKLGPRIDHLIKQLARIGIPAKRLTTPGLLKLFHEVYNG